ncbi:PadR family transcriptional regulator [Pseudothauera nasutitermitis]|nr:PadR family transcriptional regulator [Pseudothauera nasutitermitis]
MCPHDEHHHFHSPRHLGRRGLHAGRKLGGRDLQLLILALLAESPSHGYELIRQIEERSAGFYVPSPGVVYPALTYLEELEQVRAEAEGNKKRYSLTDQGHGRLAAHREAADALFAALAELGAKMARARRAFDGEAAQAEEGALAPDGEAGRHAGVDEARHALRHALHEVLPGCEPDVRDAIADILRRAARDIQALGRRNPAA